MVILFEIKAMKSSIIGITTNARQNAAAKEQVCREDLIQQINVYHDSRTEIFGDFLHKLCEEAEEIYRKQVCFLLFIESDILYVL